MPSVTLSETVTIGGLVISFRIVRNQPGVVGQGITLDPADGGTITTVTNASAGTGILTVANTHSVTNSTGGFCLFWDTGIRRNINTNTNTATTIDITGGTGDNLPAVNTNINIAPLVTLNTDFDGATASMLAVSSQRRASVVIAEDDDTPIFSLDLGLSGQANEGYAWWDDGPEANPINAVVGKLLLANGSNNASGNAVKFGTVYNSEV